MIKTPEKYILSQMVGPFFFSFFMLVVVISIEPLISSLQHIFNDSISFTVVFPWFLYRLPQNTIFAFPFAAFFSSFLVFGRLSKNPEIICMKGGNLNFFRLLCPVLVFAILITMLSFLFNEVVVPYSNKRTNEIRRSEIMRLCEPEDTEGFCMRSDDGGFIYARKVFETRRTMETVLLDYFANGRLTRRISADNAKWDGGWTFFGVVDQTYIDGQPSSSVAFPILKISWIKETPAEFSHRENERMR